MDGGQQHAGRNGDPRIEAQLADRDIVRKGFGVGRSDRRKQAQRNRQIVMRAFLRQVGGRQVDGDDLGRKRKANRGQRGADSLAAFGDRLVGKADDGELRNAGRQLNLHLDGAGFEAEVSDSGDGRGHQAPSPERNTLDRLPPSSAARS